MTRYYLFLKTAAGLNGQQTALCYSDDGEHMGLISFADLEQDYFGKGIVLRGEDDKDINVSFVRNVPVDGVVPPVSVSPYVCLVKRV